MDESTHVGWSVNPFDVLGETQTVDIIVDLEEDYLIDAIILRPTIYNNGNSFPRDYTVEVSTDKKTWVKIGEGKDMVLTEALDQNYTADSVEARYVRVHITRHSGLVDATGGYLSQIGEIEVYGMDKTPENEAIAALNQTKSAAKDQLKDYRAGKDDQSYREAQVEELNAALAAALEAIDAAANAEEVTAAMEAAKAAMDAVKTDAQLSAEEETTDGETTNDPAEDTAEPADTDPSEETTEPTDTEPADSPDETAPVSDDTTSPADDETRTPDATTQAPSDTADPVGTTAEPAPEQGCASLLGSGFMGLSALLAAAAWVLSRKRGRETGL